MAEVVSVKKDEYLFKQDDIAECMYIVKSGKISLVITNGTYEKEVAVVSLGQLIGEMPLFDKKLRSAGARALVDSELVKLPYKKLEEELLTMPEWVTSILRKLSEKIRETNDKLINDKKS